MWTTKPYRDCVALQTLITSTANAGEVKPHDLAALARAFCDLEETKRKLRMKPLPKSIDVTKLPRHQSKGKAQPTFTEQADE